MIKSKDPQEQKIGARVSIKEKERIIRYCQRNKINESDLIRGLVFKHLKKLPSPKKGNAE